jgi:hypothetical protein
MARTLPRELARTSRFHLQSAVPGGTHGTHLLPRRRPRQKRQAAHQGLRRMSQDRQHLGPPPHVPRMWQGRLLRLIPPSPRYRPLPRNRPPHHALRPTRRRLALVLHRPEDGLATCSRSRPCFLLLALALALVLALRCHFDRSRLAKRGCAVEKSAAALALAVALALAFAAALALALALALAFALAFALASSRAEASASAITPRAQRLRLASGRARL